MSSLSRSPRSSSPPGRSPRDPRLDFFRGLAMMIIMIAHIQWNAWANYIPARFGPSDAAEMFVFCSGYAAAIAFGTTFLKVGFWTGLRRIALRCWQIYWAHLGLFFAIATICVVATAYVGADGKDYVKALNLTFFFEETQTAMVGLFTLTYVPNFFDILPMYIGILAMTPIVMALGRIDPRLAIAFCVSLYAATWIFGLGLPAKPGTDLVWFFNPLAWQLLFFTGFMFARGWLKPPPFHPALVTAAIVFVLVLIPVSRWQIYTQVPWLQAIHDLLWTQRFKTDFHLLRYVHFLALAYISLWLLEGRTHLLTHRAVGWIVKVGQQALATFMTSMALAWILTVFLDEAGRSALTFAIANLGGLAAIIAVAYVVSWYKAEPWRHHRHTAPVAPAGDEVIGPGGLRAVAQAPAE